MYTTTRTSRSIRNMMVALIYFGVMAVLQFFSRRIFLERLGVEVLGLNSTAGNLLQFLNLAELGVGLAVGYALYKPLQQGDGRRVAEIVAVQRYFYRRVGLAVLAGAAVLSCFFPRIFASMTLPLWYAYASFGTLLVGTLLSYFINYTQVVLQADQQNYVVTRTVQTVGLVKVLVQMSVVLILDNPYVWWLVVEGVSAVVSAVALDCVTRRRYPYLNEPVASTSELLHRYSGILRDTRRLFIHRISYYVLTQTSPLIIYGCVSLAMVTYYGNYMIVISALLMLLDAVFNGLQAGVGNLVAEGNRRRILDVFAELMSLRFFISAVASAALLVLMQPLVSLWLGSEYLLPSEVLVLLTSIFAINSYRQAVDVFKIAYGLFADVWAAVAEAVLNVGLSIVGGLLWGLPGILAGVLVSLVVIVLIWKPIYVFRSGLHEPVGVYWKLFVLHLLGVVPAVGVLLLAMRYVPIDPFDSFCALLLSGAAVLLPFAAVLALILYVLVPGPRLFVSRIRQLLS